MPRLPPVTRTTRELISTPDLATAGRAWSRTILSRMLLRDRGTFDRGPRCWNAEPDERHHVSDNSIPTSSGDPQQTPPPAQPFAPAPPAPPYPADTTGQPTQAYPGAAPSIPGPPQPYGAPSSQPYAVAPTYPAPPQQPYGSAAPGYQTYAPAYPAARPASGLAITSLICGIAGVVLFWAVVPLLASIIAVITGHMALKQTKQNPAIGGRGMAFAGLIMGYIMVAFLVIGIVMTIISIVFFGAFTLPFIFSS
ncbi:DUF4190 domain-containing protein [Microbacterium sp. ANT_H45B]|nr:DUF4190 domain-containing protein [Microbacterium sp. ANT_H45B]